MRHRFTIVAAVLALASHAALAQPDLEPVRSSYSDLLKAIERHGAPPAVHLDNPRSARPRLPGFSSGPIRRVRRDTELRDLYGRIRRAEKVFADPGPSAH